MNRIHATLVNRRAHAIAVGALMLLALTATLLVGCGGSGSGGGVPVTTMGSVKEVKYSGTTVATVQLSLTEWPDYDKIAVNETIVIVVSGWYCTNPRVDLAWDYVPSTGIVTSSKKFYFTNDTYTANTTALDETTLQTPWPPYVNLSGGISD